MAPLTILILFVCLFGWPHDAIIKVMLTVTKMQLSDFFLSTHLHSASYFGAYAAIVSEHRVPAGTNYHMSATGLDGPPMIPFTYGRQTDNIWTTYGQHMANIRTTYGQHMNNIWTRYGQHTAQHMIAQHTALNVGYILDNMAKASCAAFQD